MRVTGSPSWTWWPWKIRSIRACTSKSWLMAVVQTVASLSGVHMYNISHHIMNPDDEACSSMVHGENAERKYSTSAYCL
ncbi:hypothetical protein BDV39DRAFT_171900 [Aspergillus sergii]|uniref:Uncharacterized protein n=1 Tax=Aspergillus sergii TaxID=1034303 RepID=A0A5N6XAU7_9EURO|nr:hypothetical protein BDV39DRAFT_171900 [Aspergillus sergii]